MKGARPWLGLKTKHDGERGPNTRAALRAVLLLEEELRRGRPLHEAVFEVFGECPDRLLPKELIRNKDDQTVGVLAEEWYAALTTKRRRASLLEKTRVYLDSVILPLWRDVQIKDVTAARVEAFQTMVLARKVNRLDAKSGKRIAVPIRVKTARNIVGGHFQPSSGGRVASTSFRRKIPVRGSNGCASRRLSRIRSRPRSVQ
jgi:hypothetical protein